MSGMIDITKAAEAAKGEDEGQLVHIRGVDGEELYYEKDGKQHPVTMTVAGTYSTIYRAAQNRQRNALVKMRRAKLTGELVDNQQIELDAACVLGWDGFTIGATPVPFNRENAKQILISVPWIREQVEEAMNDHAGFTKSSSEN